MNPVISIVMPVYNSEKFIQQTIDSIIRQSFSDWELILIDDGSDDKSGTICDMYAAKEPRITVLHQKNCGITKTRNLGLSKAKGKYIAFADDDDYCDENWLKINYKYIKEYKADFVKCGAIQKIYDEAGNESNIIYRTIDKFVVLEEEDFFNQYYYLKQSLILNTIWNGLYSIEFLNNNKISFDESMKWGSDDQLFNLDIYKKAKKGVIIPDTYYTWMQRKKHSKSKEYNLNRLDEYYRLYLSEIALLNKIFPDTIKERFWCIRVMQYITHSIFEISSLNKALLWKEKKEALKKLYKYPVLKKKYFNSVFQNLLKEKPLFALVLLLMHFDLWRTTLLFSTIYLRIIDIIKR